jgi:hypothetical protein
MTAVAHRTARPFAVLVLAALAALLGALVAAPASALSSLDAVAASLRQSPVYADPDAERPLTAAQEEQLLDQVRAAGTPIFVVDVPASFVTANGGPTLLTALAQAVGEPGTYAMVAAPGSGQLDAVPRQRPRGRRWRATRRQRHDVLRRSSPRWWAAAGEALDRGQHRAPDRGPAAVSPGAGCCSAGPWPAAGSCSGAAARPARPRQRPPSPR